MAVQQLRMGEEQEHSGKAAHRIDKSSPDQEDVDEGDGAKEGVPKAKPELVVGKETDLDRERDRPEFKRWFFDIHARFRISARMGRRNEVERQPVSVFEHPIDDVGIDRLVALQIVRAQLEEQRKSEQQRNGNDTSDGRCLLTHER